VRAYVIAQVGSLGYTTLSAGNAAEALSVLRGSDPIDLLFTDVIMPGSMNGRELSIDSRQAETHAEHLIHIGIYREHDGPG
jgi:CheY-like chemotaxis protein